MNDQAGHVLVIDDDEFMLTLCRQALRGVGFTVHTVNDIPTVDAVLTLIHEQSFDLVLLDLLLPSMDGMTLLCELRQHNVDIPIILITGTATVENAATAFRYGAQGLLLKPFSVQDLRQTALDVVQKRRELRTFDRVTALRPLVTIGQHLLSDLQLPQFYDLLIETVQQELAAERVALLLHQGEAATMRVVAGAGRTSAGLASRPTALEQAVAKWVGNYGTLLLDTRLERAVDHSATLAELMVADGMISLLAVPLHAGERLLGVLVAAQPSHGRGFTLADRELLVLLAHQASIALENARLYTDVTHSEARYRALLHHATDAVLLLDADGQCILDGNPAAEKLSGYSNEELVKLKPQQLLINLGEVAALHDNEIDRGNERQAKSVPRSNGHRYETSSTLETQLKHCNGSSSMVSVSLSRVPYDGEQLWLLIVRDISERQRVAQQLFQAEKLTAVGRLSASLAHEINNPLQAIHNAVHLLAKGQLSQEKQQRYLTMTQQEVERLIALVQQMLDFYRPSREGMRPTNMNDLLDTVLTLLGKQLDASRVTLVCELAADLPLVFAVSNHLKQVYLNLIINAVEAMPDGGTLTIRSFLCAELDPASRDEFVTILDGNSAGQRSQGPMVVMEFSDTGQGIADQDMVKIFEPFYTTRTKGTGLGLAVTYSIIDQHHGDLTVRSIPGSGTTFRILIPVAQ